MIALSSHHRELLDASRDIGRVCESSSWYSQEVADRVAATGKRVDDLTVGELRALIRAHHEECQKKWKAGAP